MKSDSAPDRPITSRRFLSRQRVSRSLDSPVWGATRTVGTKRVLSHRFLGPVSSQFWGLDSHLIQQLVIGEIVLEVMYRDALAAEAKAAEFQITTDRLPRTANCRH